MMAIRSFTVSSAVVVLNVCALGSAIADESPAVPRPKDVHARVVLEPELTKWDAIQQNAARDCAAALPAGDPQRPYRHIKYRITLATSKLYSFFAEVEEFCGSARPVTTYYARTFDVTRGGAFNPLSLYKVASSDKPDQQSAKVRKEFSNQLRSALLHSRAFANIKRSACEGLLSKDSFDYIQISDISLAKRGLAVVYVKEPAACYFPQPIEVPYIQLRSFVDRAEARRLNWKS